MGEGQLVLHQWLWLSRHPSSKCSVAARVAPPPFRGGCGWQTRTPRSAPAGGQGPPEPRAGVSNYMEPFGGHRWCRTLSNVRRTPSAYRRSNAEVMSAKCRLSLELVLKLCRISVESLSNVCSTCAAVASDEARCPATQRWKKQQACETGSQAMDLEEN